MWCDPSHRAANMWIFCLHRQKNFDYGEKQNAADSKSAAFLVLSVLARQVPRAPSLELYVLPNGGGQQTKGENLSP
jgi:hypothetical protein